MTVQFDVESGLACNTVYDICQDKEGYIWVATDCGASRYNGYSFENFSLQDGLSDNSILKVSCDSKGRVWFLPMNGKACYYDALGFHRPDNDPWLEGATASSFLKEMVEDKNGDIWLLSHRYPNSVRHLHLD